MSRPANISEVTSKRTGVRLAVLAGLAVELGGDLTVVLAVDLGQASWVRWSGCGEGSSDVFHEREGVAWAPQP